MKHRTFSKQLVKIFSILLTLSLCIAAASISVFAGYDGLVTGHEDVESHPRRFFTTRNLNGLCLTRYGTSVPGSPIVILPAKAQGAQDIGPQYFEIMYIYSNGLRGKAWAAYEDTNYVINIRRSYSTPEVNLAHISGNYFADVNIINDALRFKVEPRGTVQTSNRFLKQAGSMPGGGYYTYWNTSGTTLYAFNEGENQWDVQWDHGVS